MKTNNSTFDPNSEFQIIQRMDKLEASLYRIKYSLLRCGISIAFILVIIEGVVYRLFH